MPTRNVVLTEHQESLVDGLVRSGRYRSASEVMSEGLRMIERREIDEAVRLEALRAAANHGVCALEGGDFKEFSSAAALADHLGTLAARVRSGAVGK